MTGPEHYREAEMLASWAREADPDHHKREDLDGAIALAQVHATLALAAATALSAGDYEEWIAAVRGQS